MKTIVLFLVIIACVPLSHASGLSNDTLKVSFRNKDIQCKGNIVIHPTGDILLELVLRNRKGNTLLVIDPEQMYLHLYEPNDTNILVIEVMLGSQHLCPFNPYGREPEVLLRRIPPASELLIFNEYEVPSYCTNKKFRYEVILKYKDFDAFVDRSDSVYIENLNVRCLDDSFFSGPTTIAFDNLKRNELVGGIKTINMYQRKPSISHGQQVIR